MKLANLFIDLVVSGKINDISMPNIPFPTMGGKVFWNELAECDGWRLQKNMLTGHCRILNPDDIRVAWGGEDALMRLFQRLNK